MTRPGMTSMNPGLLAHAAAATTATGGCRPDFKFRFVAGWQNGWRISRTEILAWLNAGPSLARAIAQDGMDVTGSGARATTAGEVASSPHGCWPDRVNSGDGDGRSCYSGRPGRDQRALHQWSRE